VMLSCAKRQSVAILLSTAAASRVRQTKTGSQTQQRLIAAAKIGRAQRSSVASRSAAQSRVVLASYLSLPAQCVWATVIRLSAAINFPHARHSLAVTGRLNPSPRPSPVMLSCAKRTSVAIHLSSAAASRVRRPPTGSQTKQRTISSAKIGRAQTTSVASRSANQ